MTTKLRKPVKVKSGISQPPEKIECTYTYGYDVTKETYPQRIERAKKDKRIARMVMQLLATSRLPKHEET
jgi:hypothetical protein